MTNKMRYLSLLLAVFCLAVFSTPAFSATLKININTATKAELVKLKGVGPKYAAAIIAYREGENKFEHPEDIMLVKGIGKKIFEANKDIIVVKDDDK